MACVPKCTHWCNLHLVTLRLRLSLPTPPSLAVCTSCSYLHVPQLSVCAYLVNIMILPVCPVSTACMVLLLVDQVHARRVSLVSQETYELITLTTGAHFPRTLASVPRDVLEPVTPSTLRSTSVYYHFHRGWRLGQWYIDSGLGHGTATSVYYQLDVELYRGAVLNFTYAVPSSSMNQLVFSINGINVNTFRGDNCSYNWRTWSRRIYPM